MSISFLFNLHRKKQYIYCAYFLLSNTYVADTDFNPTDIAHDLNDLNISTQESIVKCFKDILTYSPATSMHHNCIYLYRSVQLKTFILLGNSTKTVDSSATTELPALEFQSQVSSDVSTTQCKNLTEIWVHPKAFNDETDEMKISIILKWIFGLESYENVINGKEQIKNITVRLNKMKFNGYLRLFEIDMNILKGFMSECSWKLFEDFKSKHELDSWKCAQCTSLFKSGSMKWKCDRCRFCYHEKCTQAKKIQRKELQSEYSLCNSCFFGLA